jgi:hypothetical protein
MLRRVALVRTDGSAERIVSIIRVLMFRLLTTANIVPSSQNFCHPDDGGAVFLETPVLTRYTRPNIPEDGILDKLLTTVTRT